MLLSGSATAHGIYSGLGCGGDKLAQIQDVGSEIVALVHFEELFDVGRSHGEDSPPNVVV